ncbi:hypothetical protein PsYK624_049730 [Phanerochaete sordida]|uniref:Uncharacterized protein n=1 Tax=Phanerochaete sordida TaxID=48140 RepID=A0A9P3LAX3_9APHY|nr:hypothetical protein PsYK624_049730 [Phanerochaete sordida]
MKLAAPLLALALLRGASAVFWQQYYTANCAGSMADSGSNTDTFDCTKQEGKSVFFTKYGGVSCTISIYSDDNCQDSVFNVGDGCYNFGGTGRSFSTFCE